MTYSMQILQKTTERLRITKKNQYRLFFAIILGIAAFFSIYISFSANNPFHRGSGSGKSAGMDTVINKDSSLRTPGLDTVEYAQRMRLLSNGDSSGRWPVKRQYPEAGAVLPFKRIVAYYGNLYSKKMGVLGEYPTNEMLARLAAEVKKWEAADSTTPVQAALHYIAVTAQGYPGKGNKYRLRMPSKQIDSVIRMAARIHGLVFLDIQVGLSTVEEEVPLLEPFLKLPQVHLGIDPEFSMKTGKKPGTVIGTMDAADINFTIKYLSDLAKANHLPPKILVIHRFTQGMITNYRKIQPDPQVQVIMDMDGWGVQSKKLTTYREYIYKEPVEFTGFKLFYKNDFREANSRMLTPTEVLKLRPKPIYIQYQ
jgi:hypothetical protein